MKIARSLLILVSVLAAGATAQTNVGGSINKDSTWTLSGSPYIVTSDLSLNSPFTLTVDSGVVVRFQANTNLYVNGTASLAARHARFTSSKDTAGGSPAKGDWAFIQIGNNSAATATFDTCVILWGGTTSFPSNNPSLYVYGGTAALRNGILILFGSSSGAFTLDTVSVPYVFNTNFTVNSGSTLNVPTGSVVKFTSYNGLVVNGALVASAAEGNTITFTSYQNDNVGGDTNADGALTAPSASIWDGVSFNNSSVDSISIMKRCIVSWGGYSQRGGISLYDASPTIDSCSMTNNYYGVMMQGTSSPI